MTKKSATLKVDLNSIISMLDNTVESDPKCKEAFAKYNETLEFLKEKNHVKTANEIDAAVNYIQATIQEAIYKKAFQDGMRFILNTMSGKEVIEII